MRKIIFFTLCLSAICILFYLNNFYGQPKNITVKIVNVVDHAAWWQCGKSGYTIIERHDHVRKSICGQYGLLGEEIVIPESIIN